MSANTLDAFWLPFTPNRAFKSSPRLIARAKDMHYETPDGRKVIDATSGLWCVNAGHARTPIVQAIARTAEELDFAPSFQFSHPDAFRLASRLVELAPAGLDHVFFCNSGSEAVDSALKIALAYHRVRGEASRTKLIGRIKGYHGVGFGGISVGGIGRNRAPYGPLLPGVDHLPTTYDRDHQRFAKGEPEWGAHLADALEDLVQLHGADTIAAVIVEPMAGSAGVFASPRNYLPRLKAIADKYGILFILDEVITGFGRMGRNFAAQRYGIVPDLMTIAKGLTNGAVPMGGVLAHRKIYDAFMKGPEHQIELFHGYTYTAHPLAASAALAALDLYESEDLIARAAALEGPFGEAVHSLKDTPGVEDIRTIGLAAGIDLAPERDAPGRRGYRVMEHGFHDGNVMLRITGDTLAISPPLIASEAQIGEIVQKLDRAIRAAF